MKIVQIAAASSGGSDGFDPVLYALDDKGRMWCGSFDDGAYLWTLVNPPKEKAA